MTTNNVNTAAIVEDILNKRDKDIKEILNKTVDMVDKIIGQTNKDIADILNQTVKPTTNKKWWEGLSIKTQYQTTHTIVGWEMVVSNIGNGTTTYYPLFERTDDNTNLTDIFSEINPVIRSYYGLSGGISLNDEIDLKSREIFIKAICLDEFSSEADFKDKVYWGGLEAFQSFVRERNLKEDLKNIIETEYFFTILFK